MRVLEHRSVCNPSGPCRRHTGMKIAVVSGVLAMVLVGCATAAPAPAEPDAPTTVSAPASSTPPGPSDPGTGDPVTSGTESDMLQPPATPRPTATSSGPLTTPQPRPTAPITLTGTPEAGVEAGCLVLNGYLLLGGPRDRLTGGRPVTVVGRPDPTLRSFCQQGVPLIVESVESVDQPKTAGG